MSKRARARSDPAAGVERGARPAPPVGPAVVVADATGARVRDRPPRVRRHLRRLARRRGDAPPSCATRRRTELDDVLAPRRRVRGGRRAEGAARVVDGRAHPPHRVRRPDRRRRQPLHRDRAVAARRRRAPSCASIRRSRPRLVADVAAWRAGSRRRRRHGRARRAAPGGRVDGDNMMPPSIALAKAGGTTGEWGARDARGVRRVPRPDRRRRGAAGRAASWPPSPSSCKTIAGGPPKLLVAKPGLDGHSQRRRADRRRRARRRHGGRLLRHPAHAASRSPRRPATRTPTSSGCRSCPARTSSSSPT